VVACAAISWSKSGHCESFSGGTRSGAANFFVDAIKYMSLLLWNMLLDESLSQVEGNWTAKRFVDAVECMHAVSIMLARQPPVEPKVDIAGIEPATSCMLSMRATNCAKRPLLKVLNFLHSCFFSTFLLMQ
jgi:hypothetical protein